MNLAPPLHRGPRRRPDPRSQEAKDNRTATWIAALAFVHVMMPFLGALFASIGGVHPRIVSAAALVALVGLAVTPRGARARRSVRLAFPLGCLFTIVVMSLLHFPWGEQFFVLEWSHSPEDYAGWKLTRIMLFVLSAALAGTIAAGYVHLPGFTRGLRGACYFIGAAAVVQIAMRYDMLTRGWRPEAMVLGFSTISVSLILVVVAAAGVSRAVEKPGFTRGFVGLALGFAAAYLSYILMQRTALLLCALVLLFSGARSANRLASRFALIGVTVILGSAAVIEIVQMLTGGDVQSVSPFSRQLSRLASLMSGTDTSAHARIIMWRFGIIEGISSPLGHGVGSTARMFQMLSYMHNMFVEALFELGYVGFAAMLPLGYWTVTALLRLRNARRHVFELLCLAAAFAYQLKSGDIGNMGTWMFWLLVARGCVQHAATTSPPALAQPRRQRPLLKPLEVRIPAVANSPVQLAGIGPGAALPQGSGPRSRLDPSGSLE